MSELRKDPIVNRWVIVATERSQRPSDFHEISTAAPINAFCPFCGGHEKSTPPEIIQWGRENAAPNTDGWQVRVVPNKFPALTIDGELKPRGLGMFDMMRGVGAHEVIIENPRHDWNIADATRDEVGNVLRAYVQRIVDLRQDPRFRSVVIFRNSGTSAGASQEHPHSQVIALPVVPKNVKEQLRSAREHYRQKGRCIFCDLLNQEAYMEERIVEMDEHFITLCPYASSFPFELQIFPRAHQHDFALMNETQLAALANTLSRGLRRLKVLLDAPAYNMMLHASPVLHPKPGHPDYWGTIENDYHWHIDILPSLTRVAGFEWGTGFYINPVAPENAAQFLREVRI